MRSGFKETVDKILRKYGLLTRDCVGTVLSNGDWSWKVLNAMGYKVEKGINNPDYDYVIISKGKSNIENILKALTSIKTGCIIIYRVDGNRVLIETMKELNKLNNGLTTDFWGYGEDKILGVTFKGKEV